MNDAYTSTRRSLCQVWPSVFMIKNRKRFPSQLPYRLLVSSVCVFRVCSNSNAVIFTRISYGYFSTVLHHNSHQSSLIISTYLQRLLNKSNKLTFVCYLLINQSYNLFSSLQNDTFEYRVFFVSFTFYKL